VSTDLSSASQLHQRHLEPACSINWRLSCSFSLKRSTTRCLSRLFSSELPTSCRCRRCTSPDAAAAVDWGVVPVGWGVVGWAAAATDAVDSLSEDWAAERAAVDKATAGPAMVALPAGTRCRTQSSLDLARLHFLAAADARRTSAQSVSSGSGIALCKGAQRGALPPAICSLSPH